MPAHPPTSHENGTRNGTQRHGAKPPAEPVTAPPSQVEWASPAPTPEQGPNAFTTEPAELLRRAHDFARAGQAILGLDPHTALTSDQRTHFEGRVTGKQPEALRFTLAAAQTEPSAFYKKDAHGNKSLMDLATPSANLDRYEALAAVVRIAQQIVALVPDWTLVLGARVLTDVRPIYERAVLFAAEDEVMKPALAKAREIYGAPSAVKQENRAKEARTQSRVAGAEAAAARALEAAAKKTARADKLKAKSTKK